MPSQRRRYLRRKSSNGSHVAGAQGDWWLLQWFEAIADRLPAAWKSRRLNAFYLRSPSKVRKFSLIGRLSTDTPSRRQQRLSGVNRVAADEIRMNPRPEQLRWVCLTDSHRQQETPFATWIFSVEDPPSILVLVLVRLLAIGVIPRRRQHSDGTQAPRDEVPHLARPLPIIAVAPAIHYDLVTVSFELPGDPLGPRPVGQVVADEEVHATGHPLSGQARNIPLYAMVSQGPAYGDSQVGKLVTSRQRLGDVAKICRHLPMFRV